MRRKAEDRPDRDDGENGRGADLTREGFPPALRRKGRSSESRVVAGGGAPWFGLASCRPRLEL